MLAQTSLPINRTHEPYGMKSNHQTIWSASQLAHDMRTTATSGYVALDQKLPNGG